MNTEHPTDTDRPRADLPRSDLPRADQHDDPEQRFDAAMRALHARAVEQVSPDTRMRLRRIRNESDARAQRRGGMFGWALASGGVAAFALALGLQFVGSQGHSASAPGLTAVPAPAVGSVAHSPVEVSYDPDTAVAALDENPDLYLWLASNSDALPTQ